MVRAVCSAASVGERPYMQLLPEQQHVRYEHHRPRRRSYSSVLPLPVRTSLILLILIINSLLPLCDSVKCYCTEKTCEEQGYCESDWCVVGIKKSTGQVIRTCGTAEAQLLRICRRDLGDWQDLCSCGEPLCNSYAFLRMQIRHNRFVVANMEPDDKALPDYVQRPSDYQPPGAMGLTTPAQPPPPPLPDYSMRFIQTTYIRSTTTTPSPSDRDGFIFSRIDEATGRRISEHYVPTGTHKKSSKYSPRGEGELTNTSILVLVLVAVPLAVGAAATVIVSLNYYCNLC